MIGEKIRKARENKGLAREYVAELLQLDVRTYEKIENNKRDLQLSEVEKLAKLLDVSAQELIFGEPRLVFENCTQNSSVYYNNGTVHYQQSEELAAMRLAIITILELPIINIKDKEKLLNC